jgi:hypothetical protein
MKWNQPWMTRTEAAEYLRCSVDTIDRNLTPIEKGAVDGRMRYRLSGLGASTKVRIWSADVIALCPPPEGEEFAEPAEDPTTMSRMAA